ncbi:Uncharacterized protein dnm_050000 [Desulfonema magnum]|uniref:Uncharacterized protein n=1 Tax=Desulfonema magnum TaxID=45655 RepID=A0A975BNH7_9BACT|nr:Uncharacterized protein dnm_050000 [Desulfonema magnum]
MSPRGALTASPKSVIIRGVAGRIYVRSVRALRKLSEP